MPFSSPFGRSSVAPDRQVSSEVMNPFITGVMNPFIRGYSNRPDRPSL
jgi:hypothetical protein